MRGKLHRLTIRKKSLHIFHQFVADVSRALRDIAPRTMRNALRRSTLGAFVMSAVNPLWSSLSLAFPTNPGLFEIDVRDWGDTYLVVSLSLSSRMIPNSRFWKNKLCDLTIICPVWWRNGYPSNERVARGRETCLRSERHVGKGGKLRRVATRWYRGECSLPTVIQGSTCDSTTFTFEFAISGILFSN